MQCQHGFTRLSFQAPHTHRAEEQTDKKPWLQVFPYKYTMQEATKAKLRWHVSYMTTAPDNREQDLQGDSYSTEAPGKCGNTPAQASLKNPTGPTTIPALYPVLLPQKPF